MTTKTSQPPIDHRLLRALSHPLRQKILHLLTHRVASPSELAAELDEPLGNVSYHVKVLDENGAVELVRTAPVRGALEHFYRATARSQFDDEQWSRMPVTVRRALIGDTLQDIWDEVAAAANENGLANPTNHISRTHLELDDEAYKELNDLLASVLDRALVLHAEAAPRLAEISAEERDAHVTELAMMHFHRATKKPLREDRRSRSGKPRKASK
jgi:DNA-binding transcriptional ArsR family regulator